MWGTLYLVVTHNYYTFVYKLENMKLTKLEKLFIEDPKRMDMGKGKLAIRYGVSQQDVVNARAKVRTIIDKVETVLDPARPKRRLFFDLEVSANIVFSWRIGRDVSLSTDDIIQERAIICACWKWEHERTTHSLEWKDGCDKDLLIEFAKVIDSADEVLTQNGDAFDIKWLRARCIYHGIPVTSKFNSIDTLKMARSGFKFNSNKLDYMGKFLGLGQKIKTEYGLWKDITLKNCPVAMKKMVKYCKRDVILLEDVYSKLQPYCVPKKFRYKP
jgi:RNase H-like protein